jgi:hypothetical protein
MAEGQLHRELKLKSLQYIQNKGYRIAKVEVDGGYYGVYDAWGISPPSLNTIGIEIKVSRADWRAARPKERRVQLCVSEPKLVGWVSANETYICCPAGLIQPEELEQAIGLLWYQNGRFVNKKKPYFLKVHLSNKMRTLIDMRLPYDFKL